jgi:hypothetical protein
MTKKHFEKQAGMAPEKHAGEETGRVTEKDPQNLTELISRSAYALYVKSGYVHGNDRRDWLEAERSILGRK